MKFSFSIFSVLLTRRMISAFLLGFASGLPLLITGSTLRAWLTEAHVDLGVIGLFSLVGVPYTLKFLWSPLLDRFVPSFLGRRRGWLLVFQIALMVSIGLLAFSEPAQNPWMVGVVALFVAFFSASQDIVIDAHRREMLADCELGLGSSLYVGGYRIAMLVSGALALYLADQIAWKWVYLFLAAVMLVGVLTTFFAPEPDHIRPPQSLKEAVIEPFLDFFHRKGALYILAFILFYKIGDNMANVMVTPFVLKIGFTKTQYAAVAKTFGMFATIGGGFLGGFLLLRVSMIRALWVFGILQAVSTLGFSFLARVGTDLTWFAAVIAFENLASGMGTAAYVAFMASLCNKRFTATQYALLTSVMGVPGFLISAPTGFLAKAVGWESFFLFCSLSAIPGLLLLLKLGKWMQSHVKEPVSF